MDINTLGAAIAVAKSIPGTAAQRAEAAQAAAEAVAESIPQDYSTLSEDVQELKSAINVIYEGDEIPVRSINRLNPEEIEVGKIIDNSNGSLTDNESYNTSGYIEVEEGKTYVCVTAQGTSARAISLVHRAWAYGSNKSSVGQAQENTNHTYTIPNGTKYIRFDAKNSSSPVWERSPMVEFVNDASEISEIYVPYGDGTETLPGLNDLRDTQEDILERLGTVETTSAQVETNTEDISDLKDEFADLAGEIKTLDDFGTFVRGNVSSSGAYSSTVNYRVATPDIITIPQKYTAHFASGFRMYVVMYLNGTKSSAGWVDDGYVFQAGTTVKINIARVTEDTSETADVTAFCSKIQLLPDKGYSFIDSRVEVLEASMDLLNARTYGIVWDWWITAQSIDQMGNTYIGYIDTDGYQGVLRRQPDGTIQYKRLKASHDNDDHNGLATKVLSDGRILVIGASAHADDNIMHCFRSVYPYRIDEMEELTFELPQATGWDYHTTYSQVFIYNNKIFDFIRVSGYYQRDDGTVGIVCLVSDDDGDSWTPYKVGYGNDLYLAMAQCTDNDKYVKFIKGVAPPSGASSTGGTWLFGGYIDLSDLSVHNLEGDDLGNFYEWGGNLRAGAVDMSRTTTQLTRIMQQSVDGVQCRLLFTARTALEDTVFLYARATSNQNTDYIYNLYNNGTITEIAHSGRPFGNVSYMSGACFGYSPDIIYYSTCIGAKSDGPHEVHRVIVGETLEDTLIATSGICMIRPIYLENGVIAVANGYYNDTNGDGSGTANYIRWKLNPLFLQG